MLIFFAEDLINKRTLKDILKFWFATAVDIWENQSPHPAILTVVLNFAVFLLSEELLFVKLNETDTIERFIKILKIMFKKIRATPDVGYIRLMACVLKHDSRFKWMISTNHWSEVLSLETHLEQGPNLEKDKIIFFCKLVKTSIVLNTEFCTKIIHSLISPILDFSALMRNKKNVSEEYFNLNCLPKLNLLENIMELLFLKLE